MKEYHLRRNEKAIKDEKIITKIIKEQTYLTIALCNDNIPYLVTLNYAYDAENKVFISILREIFNSLKILKKNVKH